MGKRSVAIVLMGRTDKPDLWTAHLRNCRQCRKRARRAGHDVSKLCPVGQIVTPWYATTKEGARALAALAPMPPRDDALADAARAKGAREQWVTSEGYTQLPAKMVSSLAPGGGSVWFLNHGHYWAAWREEDLERALAGEGHDDV